MGKPYGVVLGKNRLWAVIDNLNHCVLVLDDQDKLVKKFGLMGNANGHFQGLRGVALMRITSM